MNIKGVSISNYGNYSSDNYGRHCLKVTTPNGTYWFSYDTVVAFRIGGEFHIRENDWSTTTGKHLNWIDPDKSIREPADTFEANFERLSKQS